MSPTSHTKSSREQFIRVRSQELCELAMAGSHPKDEDPCRLDRKQATALPREFTKSTASTELRYRVELGRCHRVSLKEDERHRALD